MLALIIISSLMLVIALLNWGQSQNFFHRILKFFNKHSSIEEDSVQHNFIANGNGDSSVVIDNEDFDVYANDDDSDYSSQ